MCKAKMVEIPIVFDKENSTDYEGLGIDGLLNDKEIEPVCVDMFYISRFGTYKKNHTLIEVNGAKYDCALKYNEFKDLYKKEMGVEIINSVGVSYGLQKRF